MLVELQGEEKLKFFSAMVYKGSGHNSTQLVGEGVLDAEGLDARAAKDIEL